MEPLDPSHELPPPPVPPLAGGELDPHHELPHGHELLDLPPPHHRAGWSWLFALVISTVAMFVLTIVLVAIRASTGFIVMAVPLVFIFTLFLVHAVAERAR